MDDLKLYFKSEKALDSLIQTVRIFSENTGRQFRIYKCTTLVMKNWEIVKSDSIQLHNDKVTTVEICYLKNSHGPAKKFEVANLRGSEKLKILVSYKAFGKSITVFTSVLTL